MLQSLEEIGLELYSSSVAAAATIAARFPFGRKGTEMDMNGRPLKAISTKKRVAALAGMVYDSIPAKQRQRCQRLESKGGLDFMQAYMQHEKRTD
jgi:hypothetical protein